MIILLLNIGLGLTTLGLSTYTIYLELKKKEQSKSLLITTLTFLIITAFVYPFTLISDYSEKKELVNTNKIIEKNLDSTKAEFDKQIFTLKDLNVDLDIAVYPKKIPTLNDFTFIGERGIFLCDSAGNLYPLVQDVYFMVPEMERKWFISSGKFEANRLTGLLGKSINILKKIKTLRIPVENFAVGEIVDTVGISIKINVNGICFYDFADKYKDHLRKANIRNSKDTIIYDISDIFSNPKEKIKSLINKNTNL